MVLPIGGFMPIPLAMMIPFMATQSMVMGDAFGRAFQFGKRKISAMSNEEFNATSLEQQASEMFRAYKIIIGENHLERAMQESSELQRVIIKEMLAIIPQFTKDFAQELGENVATAADDFAHIIGTHVGHESTTAPTTTVPTTTAPTTITTTTAPTTIVQGPTEGPAQQPWLTGGTYKLTYSYPDVNLIDPRISQTHIRTLNEYKLFIANLRSKLNTVTNKDSLTKILHHITALSAEHHKVTDIWI